MSRMLNPMYRLLLAVLVSILALIARHADAQVGVFAKPRVQTSTPWGGTLFSDPVMRMPSVTTPPSNELRLASQSTPQYLAEPLLVDQDLENARIGAALREASCPPDQQEGFFQKATFLGTWIPQAGDGDLGFTDLDISAVFGFPFPAREMPLVITPRFATHLLDGPATPDLPSRLYDASIEWRHMRQLSEHWAMDVAVTTGYYGDYEQSDGDAFRVTGRGLAIWEWSPMTKVVLGVAYLNRAGVTVLPVGGLLITPNDGLRLELVAPRPRVAWRLDSVSTPNVDERWFYIAGEFGGGSWAIERPGGAPDVVEASDYRILLGLEHKQPGWLNDRFEFGYVFGREIEFDSTTPNYKPSDTIMMRYAVTY